MDLGISLVVLFFICAIITIRSMQIFGALAGGIGATFLFTFFENTNSVNIVVVFVCSFIVGGIAHHILHAIVDGRYDHEDLHLHLNSTQEDND